jgi:maltose O-acetyltransferase
MPSLTRLSRLAREELTWVRPGVWAMNVINAALPAGVAPRMRAQLYRMFGVRIGGGTVIMGPLRFIWYGDVARKLNVGRECFISRDIVMDATADITIGDGVVIGPEVMFMTATHEISGMDRRAGANRPAPISIGKGAWIGTRVTLLPGVSVGDGAVVAAGCVVTRDIPPNVVAGGVPARILRRIEDQD